MLQTVHVFKNALPMLIGERVEDGVSDFIPIGSSCYAVKSENCDFIVHAVTNVTDEPRFEPVLKISYRWFMCASEDGYVTFLTHSKATIEDCIKRTSNTKPFCCNFHKNGESSLVYIAAGSKEEAIAIFREGMESTCVLCEVKETTFQQITSLCVCLNF